MTLRPWPVAVGLGGNLPPLPDRLVTAARALEQLASPASFRCSPLYRTAPVGGPPGQPPYCNAVVLFATTLTPEGLLEALQSLEAAGGRERLQPWGPRTLDLDLLWHGSHQCSGPQLVLPHPRLLERSFVLAPLVALDPGLVPPGQPDSPPGRCVAELLAALLPRLPEPAPERLPPPPGWPGP
ncbi:MAG: 2-amino-4-hydroxy-6-hydroxymethyldihydropteridine diphosphokinase [Synechococcus sp.]